ncbi:MAG: alginate lyase family protein [Gammaproteobacteria bacterium]|nr:alginate lyase family protein [Gammaproteobacteria bacterium]
MFSTISLYYNTLKHLKIRQVFYRLYYFLHSPRISLGIKKIEIQTPYLNHNLNFIQGKFIYFNNNTATFLNYEADISEKKVWNEKSHAALWLYNLHYFDALNSADSNQIKIAFNLLERWVDENPPGLGMGWQAFPSALRIMNVIKYALSGNKLSEKIIHSLYLQARMLNKKCEYHLLGNHLFENFRALCMAGLFFNTVESKKWFKKGFLGLKRQVPIQVLPDGGHFELSPMYHGIFLEGLLDLQLIFETCQIEFVWKKEVQLMLDWLNAIKRSDKEIPHFSDAANGLFSTPKELFCYAKELNYLIGIETAGLNYLSNSGYLVLNHKQFKLICDIGDIGPDYLPGHGHADALSFELIADDIPVFVNLGTSCYGSSERRMFERGTASHNAVVVDGKNSSDVWSAFRVGKRARVSDIKIINDNNIFSIQATHDGYTRFDKKLLHKRSWHVSNNTIKITDQLTADSKCASSYFYLHPDCTIVSIDQNKITIKLKDFSDIIFETSNPFEIINDYYAKTFGHVEDTKLIKVMLQNSVSNEVKIHMPS